ncbi:TetR/AcrR family transcriptional regulator [Antrihabitans cavernicola]|uniref:TetR/AcrR family transcriptional regulator n=1 Tax=Antrihabitans cavernicola TaxID=2495913 RepID=A0A5A7S983_9NOCA|nr:TetR/AcrR family transcriptional regulator [Spelaeibacter cavernicola]KAA0022700.1 TetR/AcrR family transcriptional regulator [Spelaeibacter cavernicola]
MGSTRAYGGVSAEQRRDRRRAALLDAALQIVGEGGFARLTVAGLCAAAGLNERYFYENFTGLDDVAVQVFERVVAELGAHILDAVTAAPDDSRAKSRAAVAAAVDILLDDPRKSRVVFVETLTHPTLGTRRTEFMRTFVALMLGEAHRFYGPETSRRVGTQAEFAAWHLVGGLFETMNGWISGELRITRAELIDRSAEMFVLVGDHLAES